MTGTLIARLTWTDARNKPFTACYDPHCFGCAGCLPTNPVKF